MKASRSAVREEPVDGGRESGRATGRRPLNSAAAATPPEHANIDFRCITPG